MFLPYEAFSARMRHNTPRRLTHIVMGMTDAQTCLNLAGRPRALREAGFRVTVISNPGRELDRIASREGVEAIGLPMRRRIAPLADLVSLLRLCWLLLKLRPDVAEFSTPKAGLLGCVAARLTGVPARVYLLRGLRFETARGMKRALLLAAERVSAASAQVVLCNSQSMQAQAQLLRVAPAAKIRLLGAGSSNGVDIRRFSPGWSDVRERFEIPDDAPVIGFVGRLTRDKGVPELVEAFNRILRSQPGAHLLLVGWLDRAEDALDFDVRARIERHPRIHCTGFVVDTAPYYRAMDVMVLATWREGFPNVVLEAAATGIPVITTACTGSRDSVIPEVTGLLIPPGYPEAISEAVIRLLADPGLRTRMGEAGREWVCRNFANERILQLAVEFYRSLEKPASRIRHSKTGRGGGESVS